MADRAVAGVVSVIMVALMAAVVIWLGILALGGGLILKGIISLWRRSQGQVGAPATTIKRIRGAASPPRWFDAPPETQWLSAYDYWIFQLENLTGVEFSTTPEGIITAAILITMGPALLIGLPLVVLNPAFGVVGLVALMGGAVLVGGVTGNKLAGPASGWFGDVSQGGESTGQNEPGIVLGEEEW